jgi:hypothetical protein
MRLSIAPRVQSRSRSRALGSFAGTPKPKTPRLTAQQAGAKPIRVMGWPAHSVSSARPVSSGACPTSARRGTDGPVHTSAITAW